MLVSELDEPDHEVVALCFELLDGASTHFGVDAVDESLLYFRRERRRAERLPRTRHRSGELMKEVLDAAGATAEVIEQHVAHHAPTQARTPRKRCIHVRRVQDAVGDQVIIGVILFSILVVIQFVVITRGATRISEVAARFMLDGLPGRQMAIDADLHAGLIDQHEAHRRREAVYRQADFFGAMDGAGKFVRGDAVAGIVIVAVNISAGLFLGVVNHEMSVGDAVNVFTKLTIGDRETGSTAHGDASETLDFLTPSDHPKALGRLGTYEIVEVIGRGGFALVLKALGGKSPAARAAELIAGTKLIDPAERRRIARDGQRPFRQP